MLLNRGHGVTRCYTAYTIYNTNVLHHTRTLHVNFWGCGQMTHQTMQDIWGSHLAYAYGSKQQIEKSILSTRLSEMLVKCCEWYLFYLRWQDWGWWPVFVIMNDLGVSKFLNGTVYKVENVKLRPRERFLKAATQHNENKSSNPWTLFCVSQISRAATHQLLGEINLWMCVWMFVKEKTVIWTVRKACEGFLKSREGAV